MVKGGIWHFIIATLSLKVSKISFCFGRKYATKPTLEKVRKSFAKWPRLKKCLWSKKLLKMISETQISQLPTKQFSPGMSIYAGIIASHRSCLIVLQDAQIYTKWAARLAVSASYNNVEKTLQLSLKTERFLETLGWLGSYPNINNDSFIVSSKCFFTKNFSDKSFITFYGESQNNLVFKILGFSFIVALIFNFEHRCSKLNQN